MTRDASARGGPCPDPEAVEAFVRGDLSRSSRASVEEHVHACSPCRQLLSALLEMDSMQPATPRDEARSASTASDDATDVILAPGSRVGRYTVVERLGGGGMGVVYSAHDPELDRKVALKLLRGDFSPADQGPLHRRLRLEARAMAQVAHPNVVTVHDVGTWDDRLFIAMELVDGQTLSRWLAAAPRTWREVVPIFLAAGQGLAAAHAAGVVHRDFKPSNVLLGSDGRVRVGDFGLAARTASDPPASDRAGVVSANSHSLVRFAGTPFYMAPEELLGRAADARSDQFSFCVALYAALAGVHPYDGEERLAPAAEGRPRPRLRPHSMPRWLHRELMRGLSVDPADRHASMQGLLDSLVRGSRSRRRALALGLVGCALLLGGVLALQPERATGDIPDERSGANHGGPPYASAIFAGAEHLLRAFQRESVALYTDACELPDVRCALQATNLLRNAGFDQAGRAWKLAEHPAGAHLRWLDGHATLTAGEAQAALEQEVAWVVPPGRSYTFSVWVRVSPGARPARGRVALVGVGQASSDSAMTPFVAGADWSPISVTFSPRGHHYRLRARVSLESPGSIDIDTAELVGSGLLDPSFEDAAFLHGSAAWRPFNEESQVQTRWIRTDAVDGIRVAEVRAAKLGASLAHDLPRRPLVGTTYTFVAWLRAGRGGPVIKGNLALWALGRLDGGKVVNTRFDVGQDWTRVETSLDIEHYGYAALRAEIYLGTIDAPLEIDATMLVPAGLEDASFEMRSPAWRGDGSETTYVVRRPGDTGKNGRYWLRLGATRKGGFVAQDVRSPLAGTTYTFSAWVRAALGATAPVRARLAIRASGGAGAGEGGHTEFVVSSEWKLVTTTLNVQRDDHATLRVEVALAEAGTRIDLDGTRLTGAAPLPPSAGSSPLRRFEAPAQVSAREAQER